MLAAEGSPPAYDVFLSHNSRDKPVVEQLAHMLSGKGLAPWLDKWCLTPGGSWQDELAAGLASSSACAVFIGPSGLGDWARLELQVAIDRSAKDRAFRLFLVLLPGLPEPFDPTRLPPFLSMRTWVDLRDGLDDERLRQLILAIKGLAPGADGRPSSGAEICPYRGLEPFDEAHAQFFLGREADVQRLIEKLKGARMLAVLGPSGSGKSSLVRAGLLPALREGALPGSRQWAIEELRPGPNPVHELAARLVHLCPELAMRTVVDDLLCDPRGLQLAVTRLLAARSGVGRVLWLVDQFEEAFTLCQSERERSAFFANLLYATASQGGRSTVVLTLRADFYSHCAAHAELAQRLAAHQYLVGPLDAGGWRRVIEEPAWRVGLQFQPKLVETILSDASSDPAALPLLEHALLELWERRSGGLLTLEGYQASGGVTGAIARRAEDVFEQLTAEEQTIAHRVMLRLTKPGEGTEDTRRRATLEELTGHAGESAAVERVVGALTAARLLTMGVGDAPGERIVDVSHEALIRGWPRLRRWLDEDRAGLLVHSRLLQAVNDWVREDRSEDLLYRGAQLTVAVEWRERGDGLLNEVERQFLDASVALRERERAEREARARERAEQVARDRVRRRNVLGLSGGLALALALAAFALAQWRDANREREFARSLQLVAQARELFDGQLDLALLLSLEAGNVADSTESRGSLLDGLSHSPGPSRFLRNERGGTTTHSYSPTDALIASGGIDGVVTLWDARTGGSSVLPGWRHQRAVLGVSFSGDGRRLASAASDGVLLWDVAERRLVAASPASPGEEVSAVAMDPAGRVLAVGRQDGAVVLQDAETGARIGRPLVEHQGAVYSLAFSPDGRTLASAGRDETAILWDVASQRALERLREHGAPVTSLAFGSDGRLLASGSEDRTAILWDPATGSRAGDPLAGHQDIVTSLAFSHDGKTLASASRDRTVLRWDVATHQPLGRPLLGHQDLVNAVSFGPDAATLASSGDDRTVILWDLEPRRRLAHPLTDSRAGVANAVAFGADSSTLAVSTNTGVFVWDVPGRRAGEPLQPEGLGVPASIAFDREGRVLAVARGDRITLWDARARAAIASLVGHRGAVTSLALSPDGRRLASGGEDALVMLWDVETSRRIGEPLRGHEGAVTGVSFGRDGRLLASGGMDHTVRLWDTATGLAIGAPLAGHEEQVSSLAFSRDGSVLASGSDDQTIVLWNSASRVPIGRLKGHRDLVAALAFSPDGRTLASGGDDRTLILWDVAALQAIGHPLDVGGSRVNGLAFSPDGRTLASAIGNDAVLWDVDLASWKDRACRIAARNLTDLEWEKYLSGRARRETCPGIGVGPRVAAATDRPAARE